MSSMESQLPPYGEDFNCEDSATNNTGNGVDDKPGWGRAGLSDKTRVLSLEKFMPVSLQNSDDAGKTIAAYLAQLIGQQETDGVGCCYLLPSLTSLARFFSVSAADIRKAFWNLKEKGFDYIVPGYYGHITLWTRVRGQGSPPFKRPVKPEFLQGR